MEKNKKIGIHEIVLKIFNDFNCCNEEIIIANFNILWKKNSDLAMKVLFYIFDKYYGRNQKLTFYTIMKYLYKTHRKTFFKNLSLILGMPNKHTYDIEYIIKHYYQDELKVFNDNLNAHVVKKLHEEFIRNWKIQRVNEFKKECPLCPYGDILDILCLYNKVNAFDDLFLTHSIVYWIYTYFYNDFKKLPDCFKAESIIKAFNVHEKRMKDLHKEEKKSLCYNNGREKLNTFNRRYFYIRA